MKTKDYSVKEVAEITGFTIRTIRNYINSGKLEGSRLGCHWRFTDEDIDNLKQLSVMKGKFEKIQIDFLKELNSSETSTPVSCYVCCYPAKKIKKINELRREISDKVKNTKDFKTDFFYHYNYEKQQIEFALLGSNEQVDLMNKIIKKYISEN